MVEHIKRSLDADKAKDIALINLVGKTNFADYMIIATGTSRRHVANMATRLCKNLKTLGLKRIPIEGLPQGDWVLIDSGDVVIHIFKQEFRTFYNLDKLWGTTIPRPDEAA